MNSHDESKERLPNYQSKKKKKASIWRLKVIQQKRRFFSFIFFLLYEFCFTFTNEIKVSLVLNIFFSFIYFTDDSSVFYRARH